MMNVTSHDFLILATWGPLFCPALYVIFHGTFVNTRYTGCGFGGPSDDGPKTKDCLGWKNGGEENACMKEEVDMIEPNT